MESVDVNFIVGSPIYIGLVPLEERLLTVVAIRYCTAKYRFPFSLHLKSSGVKRKGKKKENNRAVSWKSA